MTGSTQSGQDGSIDWEVIEDLKKLDLDGSQNLIRGLFEMFIPMVPERIKVLRSFLGMKDYENVKREAHVLKSSGGNLGATRFSKICAELEDLNEWNPPHRAVELIDMISVEYDYVRKVFQLYLDKNTGKKS